MKSKYDDEVPLFKAGSEGTQKKWLVKGIATLAMLGGIAAASDASGVADKVDDMFEAAIHMALEPASAATVAGTTIDKATAVPSRSTTSTGKETSDYLVKGSAKYQDTNSNNNYSWYSLSNGKQQTGLVIIRRWIRRTILLPVDRFMLVIMRRTRRIITVFCCHQFCLIRLEAEPVVVVLGFKELKTPFRLVWTCTQMDLPTKMPVARTRWLVSVPRTQVVI